jgi:microcystin-dependent protein
MAGSYTTLDNVPTQTAGTSPVLASDWNDYVRDNFDVIKYGHLLCTSGARPSAATGTMLFETDTSRLVVYNGSAWVVVADLTDSASVSGTLIERGVPAGVLNPFAGASLPAGWLWCDGTEYAQSSYSALYSAISTSYNTGGETAGYFRVPDLRGRVAVGKGTHADVNQLTDNDGISPANVANRSPKHNHTVSETSTGAQAYGSLVNYLADNGGGSAQRYIHNTSQAAGLPGNEGDNSFGTAYNHTHSVSVGVGSGTANTMPYLVTNYIIKY